MGGNAMRQEFSRPENNAQVEQSWERFLRGQEPGSNALRRMIDDSWRRCQGAVDPSREKALPPVQDDALHDLLVTNADLVRASAGVMASARDFLSETGTVMVLTDTLGSILSVQGDTKLRDPSEKIHLMPGANWAEGSCGTNAIGTALQIGQPIQIHAGEHFCSGIKRWSCSASVIRNPTNNAILGAIDISGLTTSYSRHSLALAVAAAGRIENRLARREMTLRYRLLNHYLERLSGIGNDGLIVFDRHGRPVKANERAAEVISSLAHAGDCAGRGIRDLTLPCRQGEPDTGNIPEWIDADWIETIHIKGQRLGSFLVLPDKSATVRRSRVRVLPKPGSAGSDAFDTLVGAAPSYLSAVERARLLARSTAPVLLLGETGVGKDAFAQAFHATGRNPKAPFLALNCGGFSRDLLSSELFGYTEGAFTGARRGGMTGKFEAADGGTLFLDEIGEMPLDLQPHLLRVLETGEVYRIGENTPRKVRFRLITATNRDLKEEVREGRFRMDLYYRIAVTSLRLPALRERLEDLPLLVDHLLADIAARYDVPVPSIAPSFLAHLRAHQWPGNIRELRNALEGALLIGGGGPLEVDHLPCDLLEDDFGTGASLAATAPTDTDGLTPLEIAEKEAIERVLLAHQGNLASVARELGLAKSTLYIKLDRFGLRERVSQLRATRG
jgi:transcriptional regulator of acetoin/glycerol metabolism